jgi:hypothetical protein
MSPQTKSILLPDSTLEPHFSIKELTAQWKFSRETIRQLAMHDPGVCRVQLGKKKTMCRYSIPLSAARRIHNLLLAPAANKKVA